LTSRRTRHLTWGPAGAVPGAPGLRAAALDKRAQAAQEAPSPDFFTAPRDRAIYLLHIGAEVEHALMAQYLYAGYSLGSPHLTKPQQRQVAHWRRLVLEVAREEMGHLATVENMLTLIGGPLSFDREDYPIPADLYPFPFELEPLTKKSLGKYVLCEMPNEETIAKLHLTKEIDQIRRYVDAEDDVMVHRVGKIYDAITQLFTAPTVPKEPPPKPPFFIHSGDIQASSIRYQVSASAWGLGQKDILIETATDRSSALNAIKLISVQGEGSTIKNLKESHFGKFLEIYRKFPDEKGWRPSRSVATNPTTDQSAPRNRRITNKLALLWAGLFNLRYRMLLMYVSHSFRIEAPARPSGRTPRGLLITWTFGEMYNLRSIAEILMTLPLHDRGDLLAGPPFEMPYSLSLPARDPDRWRTHRDLLIESQQYVAELRAASHGEHESYLKGLHSADQSALDQALTIIGG
jgi:ferritin-like protein